MQSLIEISPNRFQLSYPLVINEVDGSVLVHIPAGEFEMGDGEDNNCPKHRVSLDGYYMGVYAVTNGQYKRFVESTGHRPPGNNMWSGPSNGNHPVTDVNWDDAVAYATWSGLRLPTEAEWERAARGPRNWKYPWGDEWDKTRCQNVENQSCVWDYPEGVSGYGCYNMSGNVWEWCSDWYESDYYKVSSPRNPPGPEGGSRRVHRGGSWLGDAYGCRAACRFRNTPDNRRDALGLRLAR